ncbi:MAG: ATP synthase F1 subunit delta [Micavibrio aeruginosavorus]|uniref:ATP synthase subunit delta n=1 Tax=Micavibrio aeruginosavorus TaxID=349221 RepID=A0A2W5N6C0_9BACT|nr:MAG: ATP synthase F1 subunit delta [Micavibrio aeruginosavorus]
MASNNRSSGTAAFRYASSLVDLAVEQGAIPQIEQDVADFTAMMASSGDLKTMLRSPLVKASAQAAAVGALADAAKFSPLFKNFLLTLAANRRLKDAEAIMKAVTATISGRRGEVRAKVQSAVALSSAQKKALEEQLSKTIGQPVAIDASVNTALIGGVVVTLGSLMIDDSVKAKLENLSRTMKYNGAQAA